MSGSNLGAASESLQPQSNVFLFVVFAKDAAL